MEGAISELRQKGDGFYHRWAAKFPDVFASDYPVRGLLDQIRELKSQLSYYEKKDGAQPPF